MQCMLFLRSATGLAVFDILSGPKVPKELPTLLGGGGGSFLNL